MTRQKRQRIVTIGGGTGSFVVLSSLKNYDVDISAIVSMVDNGGSTGVLRDEYGVLPPGDVRQCLVALSDAGHFLRDLFNYRFSEGGLTGHTFGNIFLSTIEKMKGDFSTAVKETAELLNIKGEIIPVTLSNINLTAILHNGERVFGQDAVDRLFWEDVHDLTIEPEAAPNPEAIQAIRAADKIVINPGSLYGSILPSFLVGDLAKEIREARAKKICVCSLFAPTGRTEQEFTIDDYLDGIEKYAGDDFFDYVLHNNEQPDEYLSTAYHREGKKYIQNGDLRKKRKFQLIEDSLISHQINKKIPGDFLTRTLIRHDSEKLASLIFKI